MFSNRKAIAFVIFLTAICVAAYVLIIYIPSTLAERSYNGAKQIGNDIKNAFQFTPEVTVNHTVVLQQQTAVLELATVSQTYQHRYEWVNQWMRSTKKISISGNFVAKAGFNLRHKFSIDIDEDRAVVTLPEPEILSVESLGHITFRDENGVWNWVNQEDRSKAVSAFYTDARKYASQAGFTADAKTTMEEQLREILKAHTKEVEFRYTTELRRGR